MPTYRTKNRQNTLKITRKKKKYMPRKHKNIKQNKMTDLKLCIIINKYEQD